jgi:hypothetical protein
MINELGEASIIDFDQSTRAPSKADKEQEYAKLIRILDGLGAARNVNS